MRYGWASVVATVTGFVVLFAAIRALVPTEGEGFYAVLSHAAMVTIFAPAFVLPLVAIGFGLKRYWRDVGGEKIRLPHLKAALKDAAGMRNLKGGHGDGCNFEDGDRFTHHRRMAHHAVMYGFLLCFAATSTGTLLHYAFNIPAPYPLWSLPKLFGITGGVLLTWGCAWMLRLKSRSDQYQTDPSTTQADTAFVALLGFVGFSGLALYALGSTSLMPALLALHLGSVLSFFLLAPYTKMAHGFFRLAALVRDAQAKADA